MVDFASTVMSEKDGTPQKLAARLEKENEKLPLADRYDSLRLGTLLRSAVGKSTWARARKCSEKFEEQCALNDWKPEEMTLERIDRMHMSHTLDQLKIFLESIFNRQLLLAKKNGPPYELTYEIKHVKITP
jgi:hypothetical protein